MDAEAQRRADPQRPSAGGDATESLRAAETRSGEDEVLDQRRDVARPSEGGGAAESARAGESIPSREDEAAGAPATIRHRRQAAPRRRRRAEPSGRRAAMPAATRLASSATTRIVPDLSASSESIPAKKTPGTETQRDCAGCPSASVAPGTCSQR